MNPLDLAKKAASENDTSLHDVSPLYAELASIAAHVSPEPTQKGGMDPELQVAVGVAAEKAEMQRYMHEWARQSRELINPSDSEEYVSRRLLELSQIERNEADIAHASSLVDRLLTDSASQAESQYLNVASTFRNYAVLFLELGMKEQAERCRAAIAVESMQNRARIELIKTAAIHGDVEYAVSLWSEIEDGWSRDTQPYRIQDRLLEHWRLDGFERERQLLTDADLDEQPRLDARNAAMRGNEQKAQELILQLDDLSLEVVTCIEIAKSTGDMRYAALAQSLGSVYVEHDVVIACLLHDEKKLNEVVKDSIQKGESAWCSGIIRLLTENGEVDRARELYNAVEITDDVRSVITNLCMGYLSAHRAEEAYGLLEDSDLLPDQLDKVILAAVDAGLYDVASDLSHRQAEVPRQHILYRMALRLKQNMEVAERKRKYQGQIQS